MNGISLGSPVTYWLADFKLRSVYGYSVLRQDWTLAKQVSVFGLFDGFEIILCRSATIETFAVSD